MALPLPRGFELPPLLFHLSYHYQQPQIRIFERGARMACSCSRDRFGLGSSAVEAYSRELQRGKCTLISKWPRLIGDTSVIAWIGIICGQLGTDRFKSN